MSIFIGFSLQSLLCGLSAGCIPRSRLHEPQVKREQGGIREAGVRFRIWQRAGWSKLCNDFPLDPRSRLR
jgi:hypothetical protein